MFSILAETRPAAELARTIHEYPLRIVRCSRPAGLVSFGLVTDCKYAILGLSCRKSLGGGFGLERLATAFMNNPG